LANQSPIYSISEKAINSVYGSIELSYNDVLYLTGTARQDWFSTLSNIAVDDEDNAILYPSVSASFIFSDAFEMPSWLTFGKIRGSWAQVGGDTDPYNLALTYGLVGQGHLGNPLGRIAQGRIPNANLVPLSNTEVEIGVDLRLLKNRLGIDFAYYDRKTEDDILFASVSQTSGYGSQVVNVGEVTNNGIELLITGTPVRTNDLTWEVTFNLAKNNSNVSSLLDPENDDLAGTDQAENLRVAEARSRNAYIHHIEGFPYSAIMGFRYVRDASGNIQLDDNGLPMQGDFGVLGVGVHDLTGGINNTIRYKELSLSFLLDFKSGGDIYSGTNRTAYGAGLHMKTLEGRESGTVTLADGQTTTLAPNDVQDYWSRVASITEEFVYDASFLKLRQLTLSYSLPRSIIGNTPFTRASVAFVGRNLWLISSNVDNIDPEATYDNGNGQGLEWYGVPQTRTFGFDLNLSF
ncbi:MAG: TonB-dependent receptor, partial [Saprospiraceae bacterium]|nr:TonB-dependent receptor [Saprospiraceae bacterium]